MARRTQRPPTAGANHLEWLRLVEVSGPFLSLPVLKEALPQGLEADDRDVRAELKAAHAEWSEHSHDRAYHTQWIRFVLGRALEYGPEVLVDGPAIPAKLRVRAALHNETLQPDYAVLGIADQGERPSRLVIQVLEPGTDLERALEGAKWKASPLTRMVELLRGSSDSGLSLGLVTNGELWVLVSAPRKGTTTFVTWHASLWFEEKITLQSFRTLLGVRRTLGAAADTLERLIERSAEHQHDVTIQLGLQVREAIELLVRRIDELDRGSNRAVLAGVSEKQVYEAAVTVMMRLVFVFYLEEQADLYFPVAKSTFYQRHYALSPLSATLRAEADRLGADVLERRSSAWCRLLAAFRAIHGGVVHEDMRLPAYGGHLFDPDRFPFLEGRKPSESWRTVQSAPLGVDDATVLFVLEALQVLRVRDSGSNGAQTRRLSFRELGVEQIGNVYESLLDHTAKRAADAVVSLKGPKGEEPEIELRELEQCYDAGDMTKLVSFVKEKTGRSEPSITKDLEYEIEDDSARWLVACGNDRELYARVKPVAGLVREDRRQQPAVYPKDSVYVTAGADRRSTGTHYTPPSLTEPVVRYALEPLVYVGPAEGLPEAEWKLRTPREILALRVCDLACGSGAFLVQACRYLAERLVEAWELLEAANPGRLLVTPEGELSTGAQGERIIPKDDVERQAIARRVVADRCLYGVDINPAAVEMAKLSLWLVTLQRDRPFSFLDHAIKCGDSLLGTIAIEHIERFSLLPGERQVTFATADIGRQARDASAKRRALEGMPSNDCAQIESKQRLHIEAEGLTARVKALGDALIAFELLGVEDVAYDGERILAAEHAEAEVRQPLAQFQAYASRQMKGRRAFHWPLEFPEIIESGGFDAIVGNPPFFAGAWLDTNLGRDYRQYLVSRIAHGITGVRGTADLSAYFLLRGMALLGTSGHAGLVTTATISKGDTQTVGLQQVVGAGAIVYRAESRLKWPGEASVDIAQLWVTRRAYAGSIVLNGVQVSAISAALSNASRYRGEPERLAAHGERICKGAELQGEGFKLNKQQVHDLLQEDPRNNDVLFPLITGDEINSSPGIEPRTWVINFRRRTVEEAQQYAGPFKIVEQLVRPERLTYQGDTGRDRVLRTKWWLFRGDREDINAFASTAPRILARSVVSKHHIYVFLDPRTVLTASTYVFLCAEYGYFAQLQSTIHGLWADTWGSDLGGTPRYLSDRCFKTFPFCEETAPLASIGAQYYSERKTIAANSALGLTDTYNAMHDPDVTSVPIERLRLLRTSLDRAVVATLGLRDDNLGHGFRETDQGVRFTIGQRAWDATLERLMQLNRERHEAEVKAGLQEKKKQAKKSRRESRVASDSACQTDLAFGDGAAQLEGQDNG